uniref:Serine/threonine-protein phosphatase n=1 Tax=Parastrongyloides trichosuri TaxID=131310 RepID=A0A0N4Z6R6_PARTI
MTKNLSIDDAVAEISQGLETMQAKDSEIGNVQLDKWIEDVEKCKYLIEKDMRTLCDLAISRLEKLPNVLKLTSPITVCGDIHGQFYDLMKLFETGGPVRDGKYIFLGDYVDRGYYSLETITLLLLYFVRYPDNVVLLRGNHESSRVSQVYGFYDECQTKYGNSYVWKYCNDVFNILPLAATIDEDIFCIHGGLSPEIQYIDQLYSIKRNREIPLDGPLSDLLWSDPEENLLEDFASSPRGCGWIFSEGAVTKFNQDNDITLICRSHQLVMEGFKMFFDDKLCTVWSAPNYVYRCGNDASILNVKTSDDLQVTYFKAVDRESRVVPSRFVIPYFL